MMMTAGRAHRTRSKARASAGARHIRAGERGWRRMTDRGATSRQLRPFAFAIAYRMLGSVSGGRGRDAGGADPGAPDAPGGSRSRRRARSCDGDHPAGDQRAALRAVRREELRGRVATRADHHGREDDPARHAETADSLSLAMLVLLESLSPEQRAVLLLHDVFDYGYPEIAGIVGKN